jgi:glucose/mannose-6-phosphate isomerase
MQMAELLLKFPDQCKEALEIAEQARLPKISPEIICIAGMGGSGIAGRLLRSYLFDEIEIPIITVSDYNLPKSADKNSLVSAVSASGNTEETLAVYDDAKKKGATIIGLTTGGKLESMCNNDGTICLKFPSGFPPRCTLGYQFFLLLHSLELMGIVKQRSEDIEEALAVLDAIKESGEARLLAERIYNKVPIIYASEWLGSVAYRWTTQLNENAKMLAFHHTIPEQNHNQINALQNADKDFFAIFIRDTDDNKKRFEFIKSILSFGHREVYTIGASKLARMLSAVYTGDWCSYHAAMLRNVDSMDVEVIERLKKYLEEK